VLPHCHPSDSRSNVTLHDSPDYDPSLANKVPDGKLIEPKRHHQDLEKWHFLKSSL
jgi:hypothetical protein